MTGLISKAGERITDEDGNTVCYVAQDISRTSAFETRHFKGWEVEKPMVGDLIQNTPGFRVRPDSRGGIQMCIEGEWRPK